MNEIDRLIARRQKRAEITYLVITYIVILIIGLMIFGVKK